jgi:alpha-beta hydrolase superfamily lysophospholipase
MLSIYKDQLLQSDAGRPFTYDLYFHSTQTPKPLIVFAHGFKGFKDWGTWEAIALKFAEAGFVFAKFNFSHNGVSPDHPTEFVDLKAFGQNNYSKELQDYQVLLDHLLRKDHPDLASEINPQQIALIGHSRGGATSIVQAHRDDRVRALITWASVDSLAYAWKSPDHMTSWKKSGVYTVMNGRTHQEMPIYYQMYEDYLAQKDRLQLETILKRSQLPMLIVHGTADPAVAVGAARHLYEWHPNAQLHLIEQADHVFGGSHPWNQAELPAATKELIRESIAFLEKCWN